MELPARQVCKSCNEDKPRSEYYIHGLSQRAKNERLYARCKRCYTEYRRKQYWETKGKRAQRLKQMAENRRFVRSVETPEGREKRLAAQRAEWHSRDPRRRKAQRVVQNEIRKGNMPAPRTLCCRYCVLQADRYMWLSFDKEHWFDVVPVCRRCGLDYEAKKMPANIVMQM